MLLDLGQLLCDRSLHLLVLGGQRCYLLLQLLDLSILRHTVETLLLSGDGNIYTTVVQHFLKGTNLFSDQLLVLSYDVVVLLQRLLHLLLLFLLLTGLVNRFGDHTCDEEHFLEL